MNWFKVKKKLSTLILLYLKNWVGLYLNFVTILGYHETYPWNKNDINLH